MKNNYLSILLLASLSCAASDEIVTSQFEGYTDAQNLTNEPIQFAAIGSGFNYQGELLEAGTAVNGNFDFAFGLYDALIGGTQIGSNVIKNNRPVANGIFSIEDIDFGNAAYTGDALWLSVTVRETGNPGSETTLSPRQKIHAVPYAVQAEFGTTPWTENGTTVSYNGSAELTGTTSVNSGNGGLSVGDTNSSHMTIDGDDIQRRINGSNDPGTMYLNFYGGDVRISRPGNNTVINGGLKQTISENGVMKYLVSVDCTSTPTVQRYYNGVNTAAITVSAGSGSGSCVVNFPADLDTRYWQVSAVYASSNATPGARNATCRMLHFNTDKDKLRCERYTTTDGSLAGGEIMILVY